MKPHVVSSPVTDVPAPVVLLYRKNALAESTRLPNSVLVRKLKSGPTTWLSPLVSGSPEVAMKPSVDSSSTLRETRATPSSLRSTVGVDSM